MARPVALVTGASRGIGRAIAEDLGSTHHVLVGGRSAEAVAPVVAALPLGRAVRRRPPPCPCPPLPPRLERARALGGRRGRRRRRRHGPGDLGARVRDQPVRGRRSDQGGAARPPRRSRTRRRDQQWRRPHQRAGQRGLRGLEVRAAGVHGRAAGGGAGRRRPGDRRPPRPHGLGHAAREKVARDGTRVRRALRARPPPRVAALVAQPRSTCRPAARSSRSPSARPASAPADLADPHLLRGSRSSSPTHAARRGSSGGVSAGLCGSANLSEDGSTVRPWPMQSLVPTRPACPAGSISRPPDATAIAPFYEAVFGWTLTDAMPPGSSRSLPDRDGGREGRRRDRVRGRIHRHGRRMEHLLRRRRRGTRWPSGSQRRAARSPRRPPTPPAAGPSRPSIRRAHRSGSGKQGDDSARSSSTRPGAWGFSILHTADPHAAFAFYSAVLPWAWSESEAAGFIRVPGYGEHLAATSDPGILRAAAVRAAGLRGRGRGVRSARGGGVAALAGVAERRRPGGGARRRRGRGRHGRVDRRGSVDPARDGRRSGGRPLLDLPVRTAGAAEVAGRTVRGRRCRAVRPGVRRPRGAGGRAPPRLAGGPLRLVGGDRPGLRPVPLPRVRSAGHRALDDRRAERGQGAPRRAAAERADGARRRALLASSGRTPAG